MHIYAFGSVCRGNVSLGSDVDLLAIVDEHTRELNPDTFSIYSYRRLIELWKEGNPFAWHLALESKLIFSSDDSNFIDALGKPSEYIKYRSDCEKFYLLFEHARKALNGGLQSRVFELSTVFLSIRNIATCFSLGVLRKPNFSRNSALCLGDDSISICPNAYDILERSRILSTRGYGNNVTIQEANLVIESLDKIDQWMSAIMAKVRNHEKV